MDNSSAPNSGQVQAENAAPQETLTTGTEPKTEVKAADDSFVRKERQIRQMQKQLAEEKRLWEQERGAKDQEYKTSYLPKSALKNDPIGTLLSEGFTVEQLGQMLLEAPNQNDPTVRALRSEMKAIKEAQEQQRKWSEEQQSKAYDDAKNVIANEAKMLIDSDNEFETIKAEGLYDSVVELIVETFETEGRLMDVREAALEVENYLVEECLKFANYSKVKQRLTPKTDTQPQSETPKAPAKQPQTTVQLKTLTNAMQTQPAKRSSDADRKARAIAAFTGKISG